MPLCSAIIPDAPRRELSSARPQAKTSYQPQLDGLRALAIMGVLIEHFGLPVPTLLRCGPLGVRFFFVLTGYFITLSLWRVQAQIADSAEGGYLPLGRYYLGRLLRIGPPFYLALIVGALLGIPEVRANFLWLATFQTNNYIAYLGYWPNSISHFWSLAVQEQFYLLWPIAVLTLPKRWFIPAMAAFILFALGFRIICIVTDTATLTRWVTIFGCLDSFAIGALIAYLKQSGLLEKMHLLPRTTLFAQPLIAFSCFFLARALMVLPEDNVWLALTESLDGIFLAWLLTASLTGMKGRYVLLLSWLPLVYLGRISYGIYVYHVFVIIIVSPLLLPFGLSEDHDAFARLAVLFMITVALASLSWHYLEQPFLTWKAALGSARKKAPLAEPAPAQTSFA